MLIVISSPVVALLNLQQQHVLAYSSISDTSSSHSTVPMSVKESTAPPQSPMSSPAASPTIQAPLQIPRTLQSTDLVNSLAFYEVTFITSTTGAIDKIRMDFPVGTNTAGAGVIERVGIGGGTLLKSAIDVHAITYDVTTPVSIPAGTFIRLEMFGIENPGFPSTTFTATLTTRDSAGNLIDGPSTTNVYPMKQIGSDSIANNAVTTPKIADSSITSTKPAESFMKRVQVNDEADGHAVGWDPDGVKTLFTITDTDVINFNDSFISVEIASGNDINYFCNTVDQGLPPNTFQMSCSSPPLNGETLHYMLVNLPANFV